MKNNVRVANLPTGDFRLFCPDCGEETVVHTPVAIPVFVKMGDAWAKPHGACAKKAAKAAKDAR